MYNAISHCSITSYSSARRDKSISKGKYYKNYLRQMLGTPHAQVLRIQETARRTSTGEVISFCTASCATGKTRPESFTVMTALTKANTESTVDVKEWVFCVFRLMHNSLGPKRTIIVRPNITLGIDNTRRIGLIEVANTSELVNKTKRSASSIGERICNVGGERFAIRTATVKRNIKIYKNKKPIIISHVVSNTNTRVAYN